MRKNLVIIILTAGALLAVFFLTFYIHQTNKGKILSQFNENQLQIARQTAMQIESYIRSRSRDLRWLSSPVSRQNTGRGTITADIHLNYERLKSLQINDISFLDEKGTVAYSTTVGARGENHTKSDFFSWARDPVNKNSVWLGYEKTDGRRLPVTSGSPALPHFGIFLVTPLYRESAAGGRQKPGGKFAGVLMFKVDLEGMLAEQSLLFTSLMKLHKLWIMDRDGTVLLQSEHPEMVMRNIREKDETCNQCHASFDYAEKMLGKAEGVTEYQVKGTRKKVAAFASMSFGNASWIVVVNAPLDEVTAFVWENLKETLFLLGILVFVLGIAFFLAYRNYREKVDHETAINAILNISLLNINLEELLSKMFEIIISIPWLKVEAKGCIFLVKEKSDVLVMVAQKGLAPSLVTICAEVPFGRCICGRAALTGEIEFVNSVDERHDNLYEGVSPHGHYCVPIKFHDKVLGVLNLYLRAGHRRDNREEEFLIAVTDVMAGIIERKRAGGKLLESEDKYRNILESIEDGYFEVDLTGNLTFFNDSVCRMVGHTHTEMMGMNYRQYTDKENSRILYQAFNKVFRTGEPSTGVDYEFIGKDATKLYIQSSVSLIRSTSGQPIGFRGIMRNISERKQAEKQLQDTLESLRRAVGATVQVVASAVESRDPYTAGHQTRSANLARAIATEMGLSQDMIEGIRIAGSIHDIGKLSIPAEILSKPTKLSEIEFSLIKEHARQGYEILKSVESSWPLAEIVYQHHERMDGSGYPRKLKGEEILLEARILTVADVVEAMASHRPYRPGLGIDAALNEIEKNRGIFYDDAVADACLRLFREKGFKLEGT